MNARSKSLLVRADFVMGRGHDADRMAYRRWRRIFVEALPRLLGCARRCPRAERVRLHTGATEASYSGWLRIPMRRRPSRSRLRRFRTQLRRRLEAGLKPVGGEVLKVGVRRCRARPALPFFTHGNDPSSYQAA